MDKRLVRANLASRRKGRGRQKDQRLAGCGGAPGVATGRGLIQMQAVNARRRRKRLADGAWLEEWRAVPSGSRTRRSSRVLELGRPPWPPALEAAQSLLLPLDVSAGRLSTAQTSIPRPRLAPPPRPSSWIMRLPASSGWPRGSEGMAGRPRLPRALAEGLLASLEKVKDAGRLGLGRLQSSADMRAT